MEMVASESKVREMLNASPESNCNKKFALWLFFFFFEIIIMKHHFWASLIMDIKDGWSLDQLIIN